MKPDVVVLSFEDPRAVSGGVQRRVAAEIAAYSAAGLRVLVLTRGDADLGDTRDRDVAFESWSGSPSPYPVQTGRFSLWAARRLASLPNAVVVAHHDHGLAPLVARRPFVEVVHGIFLDEARAQLRQTPFDWGGLGRLAGLLPLALIEAVAVHQASRVVVVSEYARRTLPRMYGSLRREPLVVPNGVDRERFRRATPSLSPVPNDTVRIGMVGRLHARKGSSVFAAAVARLAREQPELEVVVVGDGPDRPSMERALATAGFGPRAQFLGRVPESVLAGVYASLDLLVVPSLQEGQGIVALEGQAAGCPVVVTNAGGLPETIDLGRTGLIVPPGDPEALAAAIRTLVQDRRRRQAMGEAGSEWTKAWAWSRLLEPQVRLVQRMVARQSRSRDHHRVPR